MTLALVPLQAVAAALLVVSAVTTIRDPASFAAALRDLRLPAALPVVLGVALVEGALGLTWLVAPIPVVAAAIAILYVVFAVVVAVQRRLPGVAACGCLGGSAPPSRLHLLLDVVLAAAAGAGAVTAPPSLASLVADQPALALPVLAGIAAATMLAAYAIRELPDLLAATRGLA